MHPVQGKRSFGIAITGIGIASPSGLGCTANLAHIRDGQSGLTVADFPDADAGRPVAFGACSKFDIAELMRTPKHQKYMARSVELAVYSAIEAVRESRVWDSGLNPHRFAVYAGSGHTGLEYQTFFKALSFAWNGGRGQDFKYLGGRAARLIDPYFSLRTLSNSAVALISTEIGAQGPSGNFVQSDTASATALEAACYDLMEDRCDAAIAGGCDCLLSPAALHAFAECGLLSGSAENSALRPFDRNRDGLVLGEGAAFFLLERLEDAQRRGADILGDIVTVECATDATAMSRRSAAVARANETVRAALDAVSNVDFIVARGLGTREGDDEELSALEPLVGHGIPVTALKGFTGYIGAATAAVELALGILCAREGFIPPIASLHEPERCGLDLVAGRSRKIARNEATGVFLSASWGGQSCAIVAKSSAQTDEQQHFSSRARPCAPGMRR